MARFSFSSTDSTITVNISDMVTQYWNKRFNFYIDRNLDGTYDSPVEIIADCFSGEYSYTFDNLQSGTTYLIAVEIEHRYYGNFQPQINGTYDGSYSTTGSGGGGTTPTYTISVSGDSVFVNIINAGSNWEIYTYLYNSGGVTIRQGSSDYYSGLSNGTYYIDVRYMDDNIGWTQLQNDTTGHTTTRFTISGGGGGNLPTFTAYNLNGQVAIQVINPGSGSTISTYLYDSATSSSPLDFHDSVSGSFDSYSWPAGTYWVECFYLDDSITTWTPLQDAYGNSRIQVTTGSGPTPSEWNYTWDSSILNISTVRNTSVYISSYTGKYIRLSFSNDGTALFNVSGNAQIYLTDGTTNGWDRNSGVPYNENGSSAISGINLSQYVTNSHGYYYLWIQGVPADTTETIYVTITPPSAPIVSQGYVYIFNGSQWKKATPYIFNGSQWKKAIPYIFNGSQWKKCIK